MKTFLETLNSIVKKFTTPLLFLLIILIPFSVRYVFHTPWNFQTGAYSDFTSLSLYISDFVLLALLLFSAFHIPRFLSLDSLWNKLAYGTIGWLLLELLVQNYSTFPLQLYFSLRLVLLIILGLFISKIDFSKNDVTRGTDQQTNFLSKGLTRKNIAWLFVLLGGIQSIIAILQFYLQHSLGLYIVGESHLSPLLLGVAKIVSHGTTLIRGYGTFPHPNLLAGFLVTTTLFNLYLLNKTIQQQNSDSSEIGAEISRGTWNLYKVYIFLFLNIYGLFITFSRGGIIALFVGISVIISYYIYNGEFSRGTFSKISKLLNPLICIVLLSIVMLWPYLGTRATFTDTATKERLFYNTIGIKMMETKPILGLGTGQSVLHMKQFSNEDLEPWEIQPIHNYFLISITEQGIGAILLILLVVLPTYRLIKRGFTDWGLILISINVAIMFLFILDHYFYTIWQTQLLLWVVIGLTLNESQKKSSAEE